MSAAGDTWIAAVSPLTLPSIKIEDGSLNVTAEGTISAPDVFSQNSHPDNAISLISANGNILLGVGALYLLYRVGTSLADLAAGARHRK